MLRAKHNAIYMDEGDFGLSLSIKLKDGDIKSSDVIKFVIKKSKYNKEIILEKKFDNLIEENDEFIFKLNFTEEESLKLQEGRYVYGIKQYRNNELLNTIASEEQFIVEKGV